MQIFAAIALTILPGSWIMYGLPISGLAPLARLAMAVALSPSVVGLQLLILESLGVPDAVALTLFAVGFAVAYGWLLLEARRGRARLGLAAGAVLLASWMISVPARAG